LDINLADVVANVEAAFLRCEQALVSNDVATLDKLFLNCDRTIRYGMGENLYGTAEIAAFRGGRSSIGLERRLEYTVITTHGRDMATVWTLFCRAALGTKVGRQSLVWMRTQEGWRVTTACQRYRNACGLGFT
jgi:Protein of unknown function (DUF3225)